MLDRTARWVARTGALVAVCAVLPLTARAQEEAAASPAEPAAPVAIPLEEVGDRAEATLTELQSLRPPETADEEDIRAELERLQTAAAASASRARAVLARPASLRQVREAEADLLALDRRLGGLDGRLAKELDPLSAGLAKLAATEATWRTTADAARKASAAPSTLERIRSTQREIDATRKRLVARRNQLLTLRDALVEPRASLRGALEEIRAAEQLRLEGLFSLDRPTLWSGSVRDAIREELRPGWSDPIGERLRRAEEYAELHASVIALQLALLIGLAVGLRALRARADERTEADPSLSEARRVFEFPTSMALVIALALTPQLHPLAPIAFTRIAYTLAILPALVIARRLLPTPLSPLVWGLAILLLVDRVRGILEFTAALGRLVLFVELIAGAALVLWLARPRRLAKIAAELLEDPVFRLLGPGLRVALVLLVLAAAADAAGLGNLAELIGLGTLRSAFSALFAYTVLKALQSLVAYGLVMRPLRLLRGVARDRARVRERLDSALRVGSVVVWAYAALSFFGLAEVTTSALGRVLGAHLTVGAVAISLGDVVAFGLTAWLSFRLAHFVDWALREDVFPRIELARGVPYAISSLVRYTIIFLGFLLALAAAGIELSNLTVVAGGLGIGIGFGLQTVVNNFVSGLILLFERPIQVGDAVQLTELWGEIQRIGIRASVLRTFDGAEVIVPNGRLISESVTNWTLSSRERRIELTVGVQYGTDAQRVVDLLLAVARAHPEVCDDPEPRAFFVGFGDSALEFLLRCWIPDFNQGYMARSELGIAIQRALADAEIAVPFPQRDLHLRTVSPDAAAALDERYSGPTTPDAD